MVMHAKSGGRLEIMGLLLGMFTQANEIERMHGKFKYCIYRKDYGAQDVCNGLICIAS